MDNRTCTVDGCTKPTRTKSADLCKMHYHRQYRGQSIGNAAELRRKQRSPECHIDGCHKPDLEGGLCSMHGTRKRRHGDPLKAIAYSERNMPTGEANHAWAGEDVGYAAAHDRVRRLHGSASLHSCVDCGQSAYHWSYNHDDPNEKHATLRLMLRPVAYSDKPEHYSARCVPCHKRFDLDRIDAAQVS
jgi:hypothetical protein